MRVPPRVIRRLVVAPLVLVAAVLVLATLPLWLIGAAFMSRYVPGKWRLLRVAWFLFLYLALEAIGIVLLFALWIASGFGWKLRSPTMQQLHYRFLGWWLRRVIGSAMRTFKLQIHHPVPTPVIDRDRPLVVLSRHAGPGDSLLLIDGLVNGSTPRHPRIVLKDLLQLDPCVDVALNRLPNRFVPSRGRVGDATITAIGELASTMGPADAFVIFPEGGNYTPARQQRAIEKLDEIGRPELADRARRMRYVLPPKPGGALAAIDAAPEADVLFVGHVGLEELNTLRDIWRGIPMDTMVTVTTWLVPAASVPPVEQRETWLYDQWQSLDAWIDQQTVATGR